ncbi:MAG: hypothetical protein KDD48_06720 [Bdellovibrionales bacterium]|nr:hypothetical protein [Bdellovibrionales bacterium]
MSSAALSQGNRKQYGIFPSGIYAPTAKYIDLEIIQPGPEHYFEEVRYIQFGKLTDFKKIFNGQLPNLLEKISSINDKIFEEASNLKPDSPPSPKLIQYQKQLNDLQKQAHSIEEKATKYFLDVENAKLVKPNNTNAETFVAVVKRQLKHYVQYRYCDDEKIIRNYPDGSTGMEGAGHFIEYNRLQYNSRSEYFSEIGAGLCEIDIVESASGTRECAYILGRKYIFLAPSTKGLFQRDNYDALFAGLARDTAITTASLAVVGALFQAARIGVLALRIANVIELKKTGHIIQFIRKTLASAQALKDAGYYIDASRKIGAIDWLVSFLITSGVSIVVLDPILDEISPSKRSVVEIQAWEKSYLSSWYMSNTLTQWFRYFSDSFWAENIHRTSWEAWNGTHSDYQITRKFRLDLHSDINSYVKTVLEFFSDPRIKKRPPASQRFNIQKGKMETLDKRIELYENFVDWHFEYQGVDLPDISTPLAPGYRK